MKEILETIILNLVDNKEQVTINSREEERATVFEVKVADSDMGKIDLEYLKEETGTDAIPEFIQILEIKNVDEQTKNETI